MSFLLKEPVNRTAQEPEHFHTEFKSLLNQKAFFQIPSVRSQEHAYSMHPDKESPPSLRGQKAAQ